MNRRIHIALLTAICALALTGCPRPRINWDESYQQKDKSPYGGYILYNLLPGLFPKRIVESVKLPIYNTVRAISEPKPRWMDYGPPKGIGDSTIYMIVTSEFTPNARDMESLQAFLRQGNTVFISASRFSVSAEDSLKFIVYTPSFTYDSEVPRDSLNFVNGLLHIARPYIYSKGSHSSNFLEFDTAAAVVLGRRADGSVNFIKMKVGRGEAFIQTTPISFTNYYLLDSATTDYATRALSYLPSDKRILWDEYYKPGTYKSKERGTAKSSGSDGDDGNSSPLRFIMQHEALRWAFHTLLAAAVLLILFTARRRQRIIPVVQKPVNTTLEFAETVGKMYQRRGDHRNIADKRIASLYEYFRSKLYLKTTEFNDDFIQKVSERSGASLAVTREMISRIESVTAKAGITESELLALNKSIETFRTNATR